MNTGHANAALGVAAAALAVAGRPQMELSPSAALVSSMELPPSDARPPPSPTAVTHSGAPTASDARPPPVAPRKNSPSSGGLTAPRHRHRRSHSDGSSGITDSLLNDPSIVAAAAAAEAAELTTAEDLARAEAVAAAARPRKLPKRAPKPPWRKVLYEQQPYEDNHVDQAFLSKLITNQNVVILEYWEVVKGTYAITMQLSVVVM